MHQVRHLDVLPIAIFAIYLLDRCWCRAGEVALFKTSSSDGSKDLSSPHRMISARESLDHGNVEPRIAKHGGRCSHGLELEVVDV
jgi:hypothetical protein